ncbi:SMI1/KNR4 family protein [Granulosicoccus antarcticus]|nr:SMI1/KNR4 family protein [Granulosicoccus antarcticus]
MDNLTKALAAWISFHDQIGVDLKALLYPGASEADILAVESRLGFDLPADLKALYRIADGQINPWEAPVAQAQFHAGKNLAAMFGHFRFLSLQEALAEHQERLAIFEEEGTFEPWGLRPEDPIAAVDWRPAWFAFASADEGNGYAVDTAPPSGGHIGQIIQVGPDFERHLIAESLTELMSQAALKIPPNQPGRFAWDKHDALDQPDYVEFNMDWNWEPPTPPSAEEIALAKARGRE